MATLLRRPFALTGALQQAAAAAARPAAATLRSSATKPQLASAMRNLSTATPKPAHGLFPASTRTALKNAFRTESRRGYQQQTLGVNAGSSTQRLLYGAGIFGGTLLAINLIFNRETREDGGMPAFERSYLNDTFLHTGLGVGIIGVTARALHANGWSVRLMAANPWVVMGLGLVGSIGTMMACRATSPDNYIPKYALWTAFNVTQAALLSPLMMMHPALLARAGLYTVGVMGSIAFVGATAKQEKYLYLGGPLLAGVAVVALSGLAPLVIPATATRTLMMTENLWLYGGLAVFGGFTLYDVQKVLHHARLAQAGYIKRDAVNESISLELDFINIFVRMVQILGMQQRR